MKGSIEAIEEEDSLEIKPIFKVEKEIEIKINVSHSKDNQLFIVLPLIKRDGAHGVDFGQLVWGAMRALGLVAGPGVQVEYMSNTGGAVNNFKVIEVL